MANNDTLPATGAVIETLDIGSLVKRQVMTISPRDLSTGDSIGALTETAPASDTASSGLNGRLQRIAQRLTSVIALLPTAIGPQAKAASLAVTIATDEPLIGIVTETAPASDTASSGLNGRLQRIAQRITSLIALTPGPATTNTRLLSSAASVNSTNVKGSAGTLLSVTGYNAVGTVAYLKLYNKATAPTVGTDTPTHTFALPPYGAFSLVINYSFATGIGFGLTTAGADASTAAVASGDILTLNFSYI